jgi:hypothetical protein
MRLGDATDERCDSTSHSLQMITQALCLQLQNGEGLLTMYEPCWVGTYTECSISGYEEMLHLTVCTR